MHEHTNSDQNIKLLWLQVTILKCYKKIKYNFSSKNDDYYY